MKNSLVIVVMAMLTCHITKAAMANFGDSTAWTPYAYGSGVTLNTASDGSEFQVDFAANAQGDNMSAGYVSTFSLHGDFVIDMDFALNVWPPPANGVRLAIGLGGGSGTIRESTIYTSGDGYNFAANNSWHIVPATGLSGRLQMARVGDTLSGSYWDATLASWILIGSASGFSQDFPVWVSSWTDGTFGHQPVQVAMNDVQITTGPDGIIAGGGVNPDGGVNPAVPEPSTCLAGALLLLPFGASLIRKLRKA
jgi:hypothetical protein